MTVYKRLSSKNTLRDETRCSFGTYLLVGQCCGTVLAFLLASCEYEPYCCFSLLVDEECFLLWFRVESNDFSLELNDHSSDLIPSEYGEGVDMTSNVIPSTPLARPATVEKHTPPILLSYSPKGNQQWIRKVDEDFTPRIEMEFNTLEDGIQFYRIYTIACGFDVRMSSQRRFRDQSVRTKHNACHREGFGESKKLKNLVNKETDETPKKKVTTIRRFRCTTMVKLVFQSGKYVICQFREGHNHPLVLVKNHEFQKFSRNLTLYHKQTIINHSKINIGDADIEMFINNLEKLVHRKKCFQYAYHVDEGRNLCRVFWTDAHGKSAYLAFGDGVSFNPTYGTNKYCMVFTPFTGIDNHKRSVTFACALLSNEDEESFVWVFQKNAVPTLFKTARHRFCMWHIMNKVADKINIITCKETDFLSRLNGVVWNQDLEPAEFEDKWNEKVITEFGLDGNRWLSTMFDIKEYWILAYFRDFHMGNIMSTTQRSESENNFFKKFENHYGTLVEFWLRYESAIDQQRHTHKVFSNKLLKTKPGKYILPRWSKNALRGPIYDLNGNIIENYDTADESQLEMSKVWSEFYNVISVGAKKEADVLRNLQRVLKEFKDTVEPTNEKMSKQQEMEMLISCSAPNEVRILPPRHSKYKGSGKRIITSKNKAIEKVKKPKRRCGNCKRMAYDKSIFCL
ncbi:hypothetical protein RND81_04G014400 [Saponaria officinalis]|uniref:Protein FAR1-RELATED SEQUENCE n=1 Tax=Saponaria officinalis TaxID=3572 RepID=A0AAW1LGW5_SAPOF